MTRPDFVVGPFWSCPKGRETVLVGEREYRGARFVDLRLWVSDGTVATSKGVSVPLDKVEGLARALLDYSQGSVKP